MTNFSNCYNKFVFGLEQINAAAAENPKQFVIDMEKMYQTEISGVVEYILGSKTPCKVVMLAGPSGSGKTTTAHMLSNTLKKRGKDAIIISLDDFYFGNGNAPISADGQRDYEAVEALDIKQVKECLMGLMKEGSCLLPKFNFKEKKPFEEKTHVQLKEGGIAIVEGIHALNPIFTSSLPKAGLLKVYISVKQGIKDLNGEVFARRDIRLIRRMVRDYQYRGSDAETTFSMWESVCRGEFLYIHPFKRTSDLTINSLHIYEPAVLCHTGIPMLRSIKEDSPNFKLSRKLLSGLERFYPIDEALVPKQSLIREFIGGGIYS